MRWPWQRGSDEPAEAGPRSATLTRDERLSEYLDGFLSRPDAVALEATAENDSDARFALEGMRAVRAHLGELGMVRAPRSFTLAPETAPRQRGLPRVELYARFATAAAVLALTATTLAPSFTGSVQERTATSMLESSDSAAANDARKQGADQAPQAAPNTAAAGARSAAPTNEGALGTAGGATQPVQPSAPPATTDVTVVPVLSPPSEQPVPVSNGVDHSPDSALFSVQLGLAVAASALAALTIGLWFRRRSRGGI